MGSRARNRFTREFKLEAVLQVVRDGRTRKAVADELGVNPNVLGRWVKEYQSDPEQSFPGNGKLKERDKEVEDLRRQVARLKGELSFLKKVSAYFAKGQR